MAANLDATNVNMVTCGGQATIPMVVAVSRVASVHYAEIVASVSSRSAGPGTRANIDEFTRTTARAIEAVEIGRASCRERGCQYVLISVVSVSLKQKHTKHNRQ